MNRNEQLLADAPEYISFDMMLKATPSVESGKRFIYFEASNEGVDQQGERVLAKALAASSDFFLKFGNIDIDHYTLLGKPNEKSGYPGIPGCEKYEIGRPVDVRIDGEQTFVKAELYQGKGPMAEQANMVWESMTDLSPPARWYPSVGGAVLAKSIQIDPESRERVAVIDRVRWSNVGMSRTPVNQHLGYATSAPMGTFAKSLNAFVMKSLDAGYETDSALMSGGDAIRIQSLDGDAIYSYFDFRDHLSGDLKYERVKSATMDGLIAHSVGEFNLMPDEATEWVNRFLGDIKSNFNKRSL